MQNIQKPLLTIDEVAERLHVRVQDVEGLISSKAFPAFGTRKEFVRSADLMHFINPNFDVCQCNIELSSKSNITFEEYALRLLNEGVGKGTSRTIESYRRGLAPVIRYIGHVSMSELSLRALREALDKLRFDYAQSNMIRACNAVRLILTRAYEDKLITKDLSQKLCCPNSQKPRNEGKFPIYKDAEIKVLLEESKRYSFELFTMFAILECTGMRPGELRALEWSSFDCEKKTIHIKQAITTEFEKISALHKMPKAKEVLSVTKSVYGNRTIHLSDLAVNTVLRWKYKVDRSNNLARRYSAFIFSNQQGSFKSESSCQSLIQRFRKKCKLEDMHVTYYKFRHTMCTRLILAGQPLPVIQRLMGDNTTDVIMQIYTHVNEEMALNAARTFYEDLNKKHEQLLDGRKTVG